MKTLANVPVEIKNAVMELKSVLPVEYRLFQLWQAPSVRWVLTHLERTKCNRELLSYPDDYHLVAFVYSKDLTDVFRIMNSYDDDAFEQVIPTGPELRSCSVGDVIVDEYGDAHWVANYGFQKLP